MAKIGLDFVKNALGEQRFKELRNGCGNKKPEWRPIADFENQRTSRVSIESLSITQPDVVWQQISRVGGLEEIYDSLLRTPQSRNNLQVYALALQSFRDGAISNEELEEKREELFPGRDELNQKITITLIASGLLGMVQKTGD